MYMMFCGAKKVGRICLSHSRRSRRTTFGSPVKFESCSWFRVPIWPVRWVSGGPESYCPRSGGGAGAAPPLCHPKFRTIMSGKPGEAPDLQCDRLSATPDLNLIDGLHDKKNLLHTMLADFKWLSHITVTFLGERRVSETPRLRFRGEVQPVGTTCLSRRVHRSDSYRNRFPNA